MRKATLISICFVLALTGALLTVTGEVSARGNPLRSKPLVVGPYVVNINFYEDPLRVDHPLDLTLVPHDGRLRLTGRLTIKPGRGTDASERSMDLPPGNSDTDQPGTLATTINFPVRGIWQIVIELNGPLGPASASFTVNVLAPGLIPLWLAWLIGLSPVIGLVWVAWQQRRYRQSLLEKRKVEVQC